MAHLGDIATTWRAAAQGGLIRNLHREMDEVAEQAQADARTNARRTMTMHTWKLHDNIRAEVFDDFDGLSLQLTGGGSDAPYTRFLEDGTTRIQARHFLRDAHNVARRRLGPLLRDAGAETLSDV